MFCLIVLVMLATATGLLLLYALLAKAEITRLRIRLRYYEDINRHTSMDVEKRKAEGQNE